MKSLKNWRLVAPGNPKGATSRKTASAGLCRGFVVLRGPAALNSDAARLDPRLTDRINRISTYILAARTLNSFRFGGSYDRA